MDIKVTFDDGMDPTYGEVEIVGRDIFCNWERKSNDEVVLWEFKQFDRETELELPLVFPDDDPLRDEIKMAVKDAIEKHEIEGEIAAEMAVELYMERQHELRVDDGK